MEDDELWRLDFDDNRFNEVDVDVDEVEVLETESSTNKVKGKRKQEENVEKVSAKSNRESSSVESQKMKKLLKSDVWNHFEILPVEKTDGITKSSCLKCQMFIAANRNTVTLESNQFDPLKFRELLTNAIVRHNLPFQFIEYAGIKEIFKYLRQDVQLVSRNTVKSDVMKKYSSLKEKVKVLIGSSRSKICLTSELWTSLTSDSYICLTAHFIDADWVLRKILLGFSFIPPPHTGRALAEKIYDMLANWRILDKVFCLTLDNGSSNDVCVEVLKDKLSLNNPPILNGEFFHISCCAHILNLIVQESLKEVDDVVKNIREIVKYIRGSQIRKTEFLKNVSDLRLDDRQGLRQDVPTRWDSTFLMLKSALHYKSAIRHMDLGNLVVCPNQSEWAKLEAITDFLGAFYDLALLFSATKYPTANLYFPLVFVINYTLKKSYEGECLFMRDMVDRMRSEFDKYWTKFSDILAIAVILDPRYKFEFIEFAYKRLHGEDYGGAEGEMIRSKLYELYNAYVDNSSVMTSSLQKKFQVGKNARSTSSYTDQVLRHSTAVDNLLNEFDDLRSRSQSTQKSQLDRYLGEELLDTNKTLDILDYWHGESTRFPILSAMACDIFSIPITTVASESTFSIGGSMLDQYKSSLKPEVVEAIMCTRDWIEDETKEDEETTSEQEIDDFIAIPNEEESP